MSVIVTANQARVHWLVENHGCQTLGVDHAILYVERSTLKLGKVSRDSATGLTPQQAFEVRYENSKSNLSSDLEAVDLFVIPKTHGQDYAYDEEVRKLIHHLHKINKCEFDALFKGYQKPGYNSEAMLGYDVNTHPTMLLNIVKQYCGLGVTYDTRDKIVWRWKQEEDIEMILDRLDNHKLCLFAAYTSRGKTKIAIEAAHQLLPGGGIVLVTTPITDTKKSFWENLNFFHFGNNRNMRTTYMDSAQFAKTSMNELNRRADSGELIFIVLTVQDLRYGEALDADVDASVVQLREKYASLSGRVHLWIRDERHSQYNGYVTSQRLGKMRAEYELDLTATPYNCYDKYNWDQVVSRTLLWGLTHKAHTRLPTIRIDAIGMAGVKVIPELAMLYTEQEGYDPRKLFVRHNNNFVMEQEIVRLAEGFYTNARSRTKNPISIVNDVELSNSAKVCGLWVLPQGSEGDSASDYLPALADLLNRRVAKEGIYFIDSYSVESTCPANETIGDYMNQLVSLHGRVIILTCGKFLTGTDIPCMGHVVLFDRMESVANFEQLMGRMIREYPGKSEVKLYVMAPGTGVGVTLGRMARMNAELGNGTEYGVLDCIPLTEYDGTHFRTFSVEEILSMTQAWFRGEVRDKLPMNSLLMKISSVDLTAWADLDMSKYKHMLPKIKLSDDTDAKVRKKLKEAVKKGQPRTKEEINFQERVAQMLQSVVWEAQWVAYTIYSVEWRVILQHETMQGMFDEQTLTCVKNTLESNTALEKMVDEHIRDKQFAYRSLPPEEFYPELFGNSKMKQGLGLVYVSFDLAQEMVDQLPL
jgi:hypothetical protein